MTFSYVLYHQVLLSTYTIADVPAAVGHGRTAVTPTTALSTVGPTARPSMVGP